MRRIGMYVLGCAAMFPVLCLFMHSDRAWMFTCGCLCGYVFHARKPVMRALSIRRYRQYLARQRRPEFGPYRDGDTLYWSFREWGGK